MSAVLAEFHRGAADGPAVLVIHSWWGLTGSFHRYARVLAEGGCHVGLVDLYGGITAATPAEAEALRKAPRRVPLYRRLLAGLESLASQTGRSRLAVAGFSMGGHWAVWLSQNAGAQIDAVILYYAARGGDLGRSQARYLAHFAGTDPWVSASARRGMERALARNVLPYQGHDYPGTGHWFAESSSEAFDASAAGLAVHRDLRFLGSNR
ncbi:MAG: dienelactone hydrolase family protein [Gammaproteobacteria bacterium]